MACVSGTGFVLNSQGIELMETSTLMQASMEAIARGEDVATGSEFFNSRRLELSMEPVGRAAGELARSSLGGVRGRAEALMCCSGPWQRRSSWRALS